VLASPVSVTTPFAIKLTAVVAPWLINRNGDPIAVMHECPNASATLVLQTPSVGAGATNADNEKSRTPPSTTHGLVLPAGRSEMVPVPDVNVPPEKLMLVGGSVAMHPKLAPAAGSQVIVVAETVTPPFGVQFEMLAVPRGLAEATPVKTRQVTTAKRPICFVESLTIIPL